MSRFLLQFPIRVLAVAVLFAVGPALVRAQEPAATPDPFAGVTIEVLGSRPAAAAPGYGLVFLRITMAPGAAIPAHSHAGDVVVLVEAGEFGTTFTHGGGVVGRVGENGAPAAPEEAPPDVELILTAGDSLAYGADGGHTMRNAGSEPLVLLVSALLAADQPGFLFAK